VPTIAPNIQDDDSNRLHQVYDAVSKNIERENALINFRILWAIFLSAGIVTTEAFVITFVDAHYLDQPIIQVIAQLLVLILSFIAIGFCAFSSSGVRAAQAQMSDVKRSYYAYQQEFTALGLPRPFGDKSAHRTGNYNAAIFPIALCLLWIGLFLIQSWRVIAVSVALPTQHETSNETEVKDLLKGISTSIDELKTKIDPQITRKTK